MASRYAVRTVSFHSGERFSVLVERASGLPLFEPTVYAITEVRAENRSAATINQVLRAISVLYLFTDSHNIDLDERLEHGHLLELSEVEALSRFCRLALDAINDHNGGASSLGSGANPKVLSMERVRMGRPNAPAEVDAQSAAIRLRYIRDYLNWRARNRLTQLDHRAAAYSALLTNAELVSSSISARLPTGGTRNMHGQREGLSDETFQRLLEVIDPDSPDNPWTSAHARERNALAVLWLVALGLRRGELLGVRIADIDFQKNEVFIARRPDNPHDPRAAQPLVKTRDRILPLDDALAQRTRTYITGIRRSLAGARKHDFLLVANGNGAPISLDALNKAFAMLRKKCADLPEDLTPHVLRHTWNDRFSELMDNAKVSEEQEKKLRSYHMGWSETSGTAAVYTRRHTREKAKKVSLELQNSLLKGKENG